MRVLGPCGVASWRVDLSEKYWAISGPELGKGQPMLRWVFALALFAAAAAAGPVLDEAKLAKAHFGNDAAWYADNIPFFESSDSKLDAVYYYRWQIFRAHQRDLGPRGYISTEFLEDVGWQLNPWASLNDATGFHIYEGRWLRDRRYANGYIDFMTSGGNDRHFSEYIADAVYARFLADGDRDYAVSKLSALKQSYGEWDDHFDKEKGLYWIMPLLDATEYTISSIDASGGKDGFWGGESFRPSINSFMAANARAISRLSKLSGDDESAADFAAKAETLRARMLESLWSPVLSHFIDRYKVSNDYVKYWEPIRGRELVGYVPWTFDLVPSGPKYQAAFSYLLSPEGLAGPHGLRTVGPSYEYYMKQYRYEGPNPECQWNGPVWPFQTTQVLTALANLLQDDSQTAVSRADYLKLFRQYAALHYQGDRLDLEEDYDPATGKPIVGLKRSHHYFHSGFDDLLITGLAGLRPHEDDVLEVNPLGEGLSYFALQNVPYHGHLVSIIWDREGQRYGLGAGLSVLVDGKVAAHSTVLKRLVLPLARKAAAPVTPRLNLAMNLHPTGYPHGNASINADAATLYRVIDGRVWFFQEMPHGWTTEGGSGAHWYAVDFGKATKMAQAELAFFADGQRYAVPQTVRLEILRSGKWQPVGEARPLANGVTKIRWQSREGQQLRVNFVIPKGKTVRLVQVKVF